MIIQVPGAAPSFFRPMGIRVGAAFGQTASSWTQGNPRAVAFETMNVHRLSTRVERKGGARRLARARPLCGRSLSRSFSATRGDTQLWALTAEDWRQRMHVTERFSATSAKARIATGIIEVQRWLDTQHDQAPASSGSAPYPFFLTRSGE